MGITAKVVRQGGSAKRIFLGEIRDEVQRYVDALNDNPLSDDEWTVTSHYVEDDVCTICEKLGIPTYQID